MPPSSLLPPTDLQPVLKVTRYPPVSDVTSSEFAPTMAGMVRESDDTMTPPSHSSAASGVRSAMSFEVPLYTMPHQDWVPSAQAQLVQQQQVSLSSESFLMSMCCPDAGLRDSNHSVSPNSADACAQCASGAKSGDPCRQRAQLLTTSLCGADTGLRKEDPIIIPSLPIMCPAALQKFIGTSV